MVNVPLYFDDSNFTKSYTSPWVFFKFSKLYKLRNSSQLRQSIQEWTKWNLWKTAFKKFEVT